MSSTTPKLTYREGTKSFEDWINEDFVGEEIRSELARANILLVPMRDHVKGDQLCFPEETERFLNYLRANQSSELRVDICIDDKQYKELMLHDDVLGISNFIVSMTVYPLAINLLSSYLYERLGLKIKRTPLRVEWTVVDKDTGKSIDFHYDGPASEYETTLRSTVAQIRKLLK